MWPAMLTLLLRAPAIIHMRARAHAHTRTYTHTHCKIVEFGGRKELIVMLLDPAESDTLLPAIQSVSSMTAAHAAVWRHCSCSTFFSPLLGFWTALGYYFLSVQNKLQLHILIMKQTLLCLVFFIYCCLSRVADKSVFSFVEIWCCIKVSASTYRKMMQCVCVCLCVWGGWMWSQGKQIWQQVILWTL